MPPALKRLRARPRKAPKMSDKQPELCQVGDRESGRLCRLPSSRLPSWGAAASTLKPWELGTQSRPEVLHWAASGLWFRISAQGGPGPGGLRCCCPGLGRRLGCPCLSASGVWAQHAPSLPGRAWLAGGGARGRQRPGVHTLPTSSRGGSGRLTDQRRTLEEISDRRRKKTQGGCTL